MITFTYEVPESQLQAVIQDSGRTIEKGLNEAVDELLQLTAQAQALSYTATANPAPPPGSTYQRTFDLRGASETEKLSSRLPTVSGEWRANESKARYVRYVIGSRADQARIHQGRWKSLEEVEQEVNEKAPDVVRKHVG